MSGDATETDTSEAGDIDSFLTISRTALEIDADDVSEVDSEVEEGSSRKSRVRHDPLFGKPVVYSRSLQVLAAQTRDEVMRLMATRMARPGAWPGVVELFA